MHISMNFNMNIIKINQTISQYMNDGDTMLNSATFYLLNMKAKFDFSPIPIMNELHLPDSL